MADVDVQSQPEIVKGGEDKLKYLGFVHVAALQAVVYFTSFYGYAKEKSGSLKPGVLTVEDKVATVVGPLYKKYQGIPIELLKFFDQKVYLSVTEFDRRAPPVVKQVSTQAVSVAQKAPGVARSVVSGVHRSGVLETASGFAKSVYAKCEPAAKGFAKCAYAKCEPAARGFATSAYAKCEPKAKGLYVRYEKVAEHYAVSAWHSLHRVPLFPQVAQVMVPAASFCSEKYNLSVQYSADKGYKVASFLPLVPTEKIAKVFNKSYAPETEPLVSTGDVAVENAE